ncbi:MAG: hypothetical protein ACK4TF_01400 [Thermodesulfovibrionales bacterium]
MQGIKISIYLENPIIFASEAGDPNMVNTHRYIPAKALRGLFAKEYIKKHNLPDAHKDDRFYRWFLRGNIKFTDAFIISDEKLYIPAPLSIQQEKRENSIYDLSATDENKNFDKQTVPLDGFIRIEDSTIYQARVQTMLNFHHARDREAGRQEGREKAPKEGLIFNYESLIPGQCFGGYIYGEEKDITEFKDTFKSGVYYLGRSKNNQYGRVYIEIDSEFKDHPEEEIKDPSAFPFEISLSFISDAIIYNEYGFPATDVHRLEKLLNCKIKKSFIKASENEGFISVWRLKTPSEVFFRRGSTFLIEIPDQHTLSHVLSLKEKGIGERTEEGFGRFILREPSEKIYLIKEDKKKTEPGFSMPAPLNIILTGILQKHCLNSIKSKAIEDAGGIENPPTPSLIGRLLLMLKESKDLEEFQNKVGELGKPARDKLEDCKMKNTSLYEYIRNSINKCFKDMINDIKNSSEFEKLHNRLPRSVIDDNEFIKRLKKEYIQTFIETLLKEAKKR